MEEAASSLGVELLSSHRKLLGNLRAAGPVSESELISLDMAAETGNQFFSQCAENLRNSDRAGMYEKGGELGAMMFNAWVTGETPDAGALVNAIGGALTAVAFAANPLLGLAATFLTSVIGGLLGGQGDAMQDLYEKIMAEVKELVTAKVNSEQAHEFRTEMAAVRSEIVFMESIIGREGQGAASGFESQIELMWFLMLWRDVGLLQMHFLGGSKCLPSRYPPSEISVDCYEWHHQCTVLNMLELAYTQNALISSIIELEPSWRQNLADRVMNELSDTIDVVSTGQWACMSGIMNGAWGDDVANQAEEAYKSVWGRFDLLLKMSRRPVDVAYQARMKEHHMTADVGLYKAFWCLDTDSGGFYRRSEYCGERLGLIQGFYFARKDTIGDIETIAYHKIPFLAEYPAAHGTEWPAIGEQHCSPGYFMSEIKRYSSHDNWNFGRRRRVTHGTVYDYVSDAMCRKPWSQAHRYMEADCVDISDSVARSMGYWIGCPAGMFFVSGIMYYDMNNGYVMTKLKCCPLTM